MHVVIDLDGLNTARGKVVKSEVLLALSCPAIVRESCYIPAESFTLDDIDAIRELHKLLSEMLDAHAAMTNRPALPPLPGVKL